MNAPPRGSEPDPGGQWLDPGQWPAAIEGHVASVLRAVGQLLVAVAGDPRAVERATPQEATQTSHPALSEMERLMNEPREPRPSLPPSDAEGDDVSSFSPTRGRGRTN